MTLLCSLGSLCSDSSPSDFLELSYFFLIDTISGGQYERSSYLKHEVSVSSYFNAKICKTRISGSVCLVHTEYPLTISLFLSEILVLLQMVHHVLLFCIECLKLMHSRVIMCHALILGGICYPYIPF